MTQAADLATGGVEVRPEFQRGSRAGLARNLLNFTKRQPIGAFSAVLIVVILLCAIAAPLIAPYHYSERIRGARPLESPSSEHIMGIDHQARDEFSRVIYGSRTTVKVGLGAAAITTVVALAIGIISAYMGGIVDLILQRIVDTMMALPGIVVILAIFAFVGGGELSVAVVLGLLLAPGSSRVIRGAALAIASTTYVEAARATGAPGWRIVARHVLPNVFAPAMVVGTLAVGNAVLAEASLSFLGFGVVPPTPSWGGMLSGSGRQYMQVAPWLAIFPGLAISLTVFAFNMLGDALRDVTDPRLRGR